MNQALDEWIAKAEGDFATAGRELRARRKANYDAVCFHSQQCAEKYLKSILTLHEKHIPKIHFLLELLALIEKFDPSYEFLKPDLESLEDFSVRFRYPGEFADKEDARKAYSSLKVIRKFIRPKLGLKG